MADEPVLCFDGDGAGRRAAYRAVDLALPHIKPGKTVKFALLPEGQDPDDLVALRRPRGDRRGDRRGAAARRHAVAARDRSRRLRYAGAPRRARPARIAEVTNAIGDPSVRKYYRQDLDERVRAQLFAPQRAAAERGAFTPRAVPVRHRDAVRGEGRGNSSAAAGGARDAAERAACDKPDRARRAQALPSREALILLAVINHPWLLETHAEELAELEFRHADGDRLRAGHSGCRRRSRNGRPGRMRAAITARDLARCSRGSSRRLPIRRTGRRGKARGREDVSLWWTHVVSLHRKSRTLHKELKDAELALGSEPSEENLAWLRDIQARLAALEGAEALIDGFGALSGRPVRTFWRMIPEKLTGPAVFGPDQIRPG